MTDVFRPRSVDEAVRIAAERPVTFAAGCTDLFPATSGRRLGGEVIDLTAIDGIRGITETADGWRIGAMTTWTDIRRADLPAAFDGLKAAAREVGSVQIQNAGTVGGNLCNASPAADGVPPLLTLEAEVELAGPGGTRRLPLAAFLNGPRRTALAPGEILSAVLIPKAAGAGRSAFLKLGARKYLVISIAMVAARIVADGGRIAHASVAVGACSAVATRLSALEALLAGARIEDAPGLATDAIIAPALSPIADIRADEAYRRGAAAELVRRALAELAEQVPA